MPQTPDPPLRVEVTEGVAWLDLDDGKANALSEERLGDLDRALDRAEAEEAVVVIRGREGIFSAGFDLPTFGRGAEAAVAMVRAGAELILRLLAHPAPVLTVCTGHAYPMGAFLMLSADVRLALAGNWRIGMNEVAIGLTIPEFAVELARHRLSPPGFAASITGRLFGPEDARRLGYVDRVLPPERLEAAVQEEVQRLLRLDRSSHAATKARVNGQAIAAIRSALDRELDAVSAAL